MVEHLRGTSDLLKLVEGQPNPENYLIELAISLLPAFFALDISKGFSHPDINSESYSAIAFVTELLRFGKGLTPWILRTKFNRPGKIVEADIVSDPYYKNRTAADPKLNRAMTGYVFKEPDSLAVAQNPGILYHDLYQLHQRVVLENDWRIIPICWGGSDESILALGLANSNYFHFLRYFPGQQVSIYRLKNRKIK